MKKVMVMFAVIAMAVAASASTFSWGLSSGTLDKDTFAGGTAYLFYGGSVLPTVNTAVDSFTVADITAAGWTQYDSGTVGADGSFSKNLGNVTSVNGSTGSVKFYMAVLSTDGETVAVSTTIKTAQIRNTTTAASAAWTGTGFTTYTAEGGGGDVPEPTSGLLLLVGGAMLALRRRRA